MDQPQRGKSRGRARGRSRRGRSRFNPSLTTTTSDSEAPISQDSRQQSTAPGGRSQDARPNSTFKRRNPTVDQSRGLSSASPPTRRNQGNRDLSPQRKREIQPVDADLASFLLDKLSSGTYECMICYEKVKVKAKIWSCSTCHASLHTHCIPCFSNSLGLQTWEKNTASFRCPGCQAPIPEASVNYSCYCGKERDPVYSPLLTPHSCGGVCGKERECIHPCNALCHPGPCRPCEAFSPPVPCYCAKSSFVKTCAELASNQSSILSCGDVCGGILNCRIHNCTENCHPGECGKCVVLNSVPCRCGKESRDFPCKGTSDPQAYQCEQECGFEFACGHHSCLEVCHIITLKHCHDVNIHPTECPRDPALLKTCPCGKTELTRESCLDEIKVCDSYCGKSLSCGHECSSKCHLGSCPPCSGLVFFILMPSFYSAAM
jgi:transcriptional repressor NF-X1